MDAACSVLKTRLDSNGYDDSEMQTGRVIEGYALCLAYLG